MVPLVRFMRAFLAVRLLTVLEASTFTSQKNTVWSYRSLLSLCPLALIVGSAKFHSTVPTRTLVQGIKSAQRVCMKKQARVSTLRTIMSCQLVRVTAFIRIAIGAIICLLNRVMRIL